MAHAELDRLQACLNFALNTFRKEMDESQLPPLSQHSSVEHPLDDINYLPSTRLFEARRLSLSLSLCLLRADANPDLTSACLVRD
jgi:hypothetical protein